MLNDLILATADQIRQAVPEKSGKEALLEKNIHNFCDQLLTENRGKGAALLSHGLTLSEGAKLTGVSASTISEGREKLNNPSALRQKTPKPSDATLEERQLFEDFVFATAQVRSGTIKERRLKENLVRKFYDKDYKPWAESLELPVRKYNTIRTWLKEIGVKPGRFDRYRCKICFDGRLALQREKMLQASREGDEALIAKYNEHIKLVEVQHAESKLDKQINQKDTSMYFRLHNNSRFDH